MGKVLTLEERKAIQKGLENKVNVNQIGRSLQRADTTIHTEINRYGHGKEYDAQKAHDASMETKAQQHRKKAESLRAKKKTSQTLSERMDLLDMQIEILIDKIQELGKK